MLTCNLLLWYNQQISIFSIITPVFMSHDPSQISLIYWLAAQETFLVIITDENSCVASYLCGNGDIESPKNWIYLKKMYSFI